MGCFTNMNCFSFKSRNVLFPQATERKKHPSISICFQLLLFLSSSGRFSFFFFLMFLRQCSRLRISPRCPVLDARASRSRKKQSTFVNCFSLKTGNDLFSQAVSRQVSSALKSLTSVFGMGTGGSSSPLSPDFILSFLSTQTMKNLSSLTSLRLSPSLG